MKSVLSLAAAALFSGLVACAPTDEPAVQTPTTAEACRAAGGDWRPEGRLQRPMCVVRYADGGRTCRDSDDCQGECRLPDSVEAAAATGAVAGVCQVDSSPFGCFTRVEDGRAEPTLCVD